MIKNYTVLKEKSLKSPMALQFVQHLFLDDERVPDIVDWCKLNPNLHYGIVRNGKDFFYAINLLLSKNLLPKTICFDHDLGDYQKVYVSQEMEEQDVQDLALQGVVVSSKELLADNINLRNFYLNYGKKISFNDVYTTLEVTGKSCLQYFTEQLLSKLEDGQITVIDIESIDVHFHSMNLVAREQMVALWNNFISFINKEFVLNKYKNGNATITIYKDGTRVTEYPDGEELKLDFPLNIDIRLMTKCDFGYNPNTGKSVCAFCHESARTDGKECNYETLLQKIKHLPAGIEIAIGINDFTEGLEYFLSRCQAYGFVVNGTVNQGALAKKTNLEKLKSFIEKDYLKGVGVSYRPRMPKMPGWIVNYKNTVVHVIAGIDDFEGVYDLHKQGVKKVLVLGEKDFGFNKGKVNLNSESHIKWKNNIMKLTKVFDVVSFDNLALKQLSIKEHLPDEDWNEFYQGEHSFYINAVEEYFAPSSRSNLHIKKFNETSLEDYFKFLEQQTIDIKDVSHSLKK